MSARELIAQDQANRPVVMDGRSALSVLRSAAPLVSIAGGTLILLALGHSWWELILVATFGLVALQPALVHDTALARSEVEASDPDTPRTPARRSSCHRGAASERALAVAQFLDDADAGNSPATRTTESRAGRPRTVVRCLGGRARR